MTDDSAQTSAPTPTSSPTPTPTPASVSGDVPVEAWRSRLEDAKTLPASERHEHLGALLDDLDGQVGSL
ncbi:hypothetical protein [Brevibacterium atlanticum]|uniref:hypothetical protein n=1 Tax=Brevibacterium atlanticum TaxID=2697563 RepID=UPI0014212605|nr:hypothetical protein [Brevibacterium atlanticum]